MEISAKSRERNLAVHGASDFSLLGKVMIGDRNQRRP